MAVHDVFPTASWPHLRRRAELLRAVRDWFSARGFLEVETPILSADIVVDRHLDPLSAVLFDDPRRPEAGRRLWLQTSPEFAMKRLLAAGAEAIFQVSRVFRGGERGALHNAEFTMVEWYRRGDNMAEGIGLLDELCQAMLGAGPAERLTYGEAFARHVGLDPHTATVTALEAAAEARGIAVPPGFADAGHDDWLDLLLVELVQPHLGQGRPTILYDYPATQAALARVRGANPPVAERFELFVGGIELANGYHELLDAAELRRRNALANDQRARDGKPRLPEESRLLAAMELGLPECTGVALGFDRLVMVAVGAKTLAEVVAFPIELA